MRNALLWTGLATVLLLQGCVHATAQPLAPNTANTELKQRYYQAKTTAADGTVLFFTVYQPALKVGQTAPLILHTHGFGLSRMKRPNMSLYGFLLPTGQVAKDAWQNGYWVISYDQRGHGDSQGKIHLTDPEKEARDVSAILDWAEQHLPQLAKNTYGVRTGMIGESYAGGVQYIASAQEPRLQALVPITTWYDLTQSLVPNGVAKNNWMDFLNLIGDWWNWNKFSPELKYAYQQIQQDKLQTSTYDFIKTHQASWYCQHQQAPQADALIIQGFRDVLFPFDQGVQAAQCLKQAKREVHLIGVEGGHLQPLTQYPPRGQMPIWYIGKSVRCGEHQQQYTLETTILQWFNQKLKDQSIAQTLPEVCVDQSPVSKLQDLQPVTAYTIQKTWIAPSKKQAVFVPIQTVNQNMHITGSVELNLNVEHATKADPTLFISVATKSAKTGQYTILNDQVAPFNALKKQQYDQIVPYASPYIELPAINTTLQQGDTLGLLINSHSPYYKKSNQHQFEAWISGQMRLPHLWQQPPAP